MMKQSTHSAIFLCLLSITLSPHAEQVPAQAPTIDPAKDAEYFEGARQTPTLFWSREQQVAGYRNMDKLGPVRLIEAGDIPSALPKQLQDLSKLQITLKGSSISLEDYLNTFSVAGLLVIQDGKIRYERYGLGNTEQSRWVSFSVAKSVVAMLIGAAIQDGYIQSVEDKVTDYLPRLKNSPYAQVSIRNLLQMSSGVEWNEDYADKNSDVASASWATLDLYNYLNKKKRIAKEGEKFNYNTAETNLAGTLLRSAIGNNLSTYLADKVWQPFGMEADAYWQLTEPGGGEFGGCCINATLRDYGRIGLFALTNGKLADGTQVLPETWMKDSTMPSKGFDGYGYFWWLDKDTYEASGIFGQGIYIAPDKNLVIALHSARPEAGGESGWAWQAAMYESINKAF
ncbi:MAG: serine hydrolase [Pseudomonadota bacterium]